MRGAAGERPRGPLPHHAGPIFYHLVEVVVSHEYTGKSISSLLPKSKIYCYVNVRFLFVRLAHGTCRINTLYTRTYSHSWAHNR